ncbi:hypothetical protein EDD85DRAFT_793346 [Armillaria nabsnona]|nr:hypothetical protein EDD85DRAFT_793346 [Armillaria nabsnona]
MSGIFSRERFTLPGALILSVYVAANGGRTHRITTTQIDLHKAKRLQRGCFFRPPSALAHPGTSNSDGPKSRSLQAAPPPGSATASILHSLPPPITAFSGIRTPKVEKAKDLRNISQMSSLPQNKNKKASSLNPDKTGAMKLNVFLYPLCGDTQVDVGPMGPQTLSVRADQLSTVYETVFRRRALAFGLNIPSKSLPLILLYQALKESAATGNYAVPGLEKFDASHPDLAKIQYDSTFPFTVMEHQVRDGRYKFKPDGRLCPGNFTGEALQKLCKNFNPLPEGSSNEFFLVIAPRFGNITASLEDFDCGDEPQRRKEVHRCWPYRVLYDADVIDSDDDISDFSSCAGSPMKGVVDLTPKEIIEIPDSPDRDFSPPPVETALSAAMFASSTIGSVTVGSISTLVLRRFETVFYDVRFRAVRNPPASFKKDEYPNIAVFSLSSPQFELQDLLSRWAYDRQYRIRGGAVGPAVERVIQLASLQEMVSDHEYWRHRADGSFSLYVSASEYVSQRRTDYLEASGRLIAWSLLHLGQGFVVLPWVVLAIVAGREAFSALTYEDIAAISTADAVPLQSFLALEPKSTLQYDTSRDADNSAYRDLQYIFGLTLGFDMVDLKHPRSEQEHAHLKGRVCCAVLLDHDTYWEHPDFLALRKGFDLQLHYSCESTTLLEKTKRYPAMRLIQQLHSPFIDVEDLITHIEFKIPDKKMDLHEGKYQRAIFLLFQHRIKTYLRGRGHPRSTRGGLVDEAQFDKEKDVATIRGALLLSAMRGLPRPPIDPSYALIFNCHFPSKPRSAMFEMHACLSYADVNLTKEIAQLLAAPGDDQDHPSFAFFHGQCINAISDFNAA